MTTTGRSLVGSKSNVSATFLHLALAPYRPQLLALLREGHFSKNVHTTLTVTGVPDTTAVTIFAWPEPYGACKRIAVDVVQLDDRVLLDPVPLFFDVAPTERPSGPPTEVSDALLGAPVVTFGDVRWYKIAAEDGKKEREVQKLKSDGSPVYAAVDTTEYNYFMSCPECGRMRYAKRNSLHQIAACRVCTRQERLRKRALYQYRTRRCR